MKRILLLFLFFAFSIKGFSQCDTIKERADLITIYNALDGDNWYFNTNWGSNKPIGEWYRIQTDKKGCLSRITLANNNIKGYIPSEIGNFQQLKRINFVGNAIHSTIPKEIGNLNKLEYLNLSYNDLTGGIPPEIGNISQLHELHLNDNSLSGIIPPEIGNLDSLVKLDISHNKLSGSLPPELSFLTNASTINIAYNNLSGCFPDSYFETLCSSLISNINPQLPYLGSSWKICNGADQIGAPCDDGNPETKNDVIEDDCSCAGLVKPLNCSFQRDILKGFYRLAHGDQWINHENWGTDKPLSEWFGVTASSLDGCPTSIQLPSNNLDGIVSSDIRRLKKLRHLDLSDNHLQGTVLGSLVELPRLVEIKLNNNEFEDEIPSNLSNLKFLEYLNLSHNKFSGSIPEDIANLHATSIFLDNNNLSGCFPDTIIRKFCNQHFSPNDTTDGYNFSINLQMPYTGNLNPICADQPQFGAPCIDNDPNTSGETIDEDCNCTVSRCQKKDRATLMSIYESTDGENWYDNTHWGGDAYIGTWFGVTTNTEGCVTQLDLHNNNLGGELPETLGQFSKLEQLNLYKNNLSGSIPKELGDLSELKVLRLFGNQFSGNIPHELGALNQLEIVNLSQNQLTGTIPNELMQLSGLTSLLLSKNKISGTIPKDIGNLKKLDNVSLGYNQLSGYIPDGLTSLKQLRKVDFSHNNISGTIPPKVVNMEQLAELKLNHNQMYGFIPDSLGNLLHLYILNLSENNFFGCIPTSIINKKCVDSKHIELQNNHLMPFEGDIDQLCNDVAQIGAPCNDGDTSTPIDKIDENCLCNGKTVATTEIQNTAKITIYPNPANDVLHFKIDQKNWTGKTNIVFYNLLGEDVRQLIIPEGSDSLDYEIDIPSGVYFCRVGGQVLKVVIAR